MAQRGTKSERTTDANRKRVQRSEAAEVVIRDCKNPQRRERCLADPELFLKTYGMRRFTNPFTNLHRRIMSEIIERAKYGGDKSLAAPRGDGKTKVSTGMMPYCMLNQWLKFPIVFEANGALAFDTYQDFKDYFELSPLMLEDFPEICCPVKELEGAPQRAGKQHVGGVLTQIEWSATDVVFPHVPGSPYGGYSFSYRGFDSAFRGVTSAELRPDFALINDPETKDSARNDDQIALRLDMLNKDIAGLGGQDGSIARVLLTTIQNSRCLSAKLTDPKQYPSWGGERFSAVIKWPDHPELWEEYIAQRQADQSGGDSRGTKANAMYADRFEEMNAGCIMGNPARYSKAVYEDGSPVERTAIQHIYNEIARIGLDAVLAEYQNDPRAEAEAETMGLTAGKVASRISGYAQHELPPDTIKAVCCMDIGKYFSHWVKVAWGGNAVGSIIDYGVMETHGMAAATSPKAVSLALLSSLLNWRDEILKGFPIDFGLIDSGDYSDAIYEFIRQTGGTPFAASKGFAASRFHIGKDAPDRRCFLECAAQRQTAERVWLYNVNTEFWKQWAQERFLTETFDDNHHRNDGTLSLFKSDDKKKHLSFSHHIVAEERREIFEPGKGLVRKWFAVNQNNHWLDAIALACAAAGCVGIRLVPRTSLSQLQAVALRKPKPANFTGLHGQPFLITER